MKNATRFLVVSLVSLALALQAPVRAQATTTPLHSNDAPSRIAAMAPLEIPTASAAREVAAAKAATAAYRHLLPPTLRLVPGRARAFGLPDGQVLVSVPLAGTGWSGGSFSFMFQHGDLIRSQQLLILETFPQSGRLLLYSDGILVLDRQATSEPQAGLAPMSNFTDCYNAMPGWMTQLVGFICGVGCLTAVNPISMGMCLTCMLGLGGMYASFALKCLAER